MQRIAGPGHVGNRFDEGNPAIGQQATMVTAAFMNAVQEEIARACELAGIALDPDNNEQLYAAILAIAAGAAGAGGGAVPTTRTVTAAGLATGGGDLAANRVITVPKASAVEVAAGTDDTKAITPLALQGGAGASLMAGIGYKTIFGLMFQWGTFSVGGNSSATIAFPTSFPTMCVHADVAAGASGYGAQDNNPFVSGKSAGALTVLSAVDSTLLGTYFAIGF